MLPVLDDYSWGEAFGYAGEDGKCGGALPVWILPEGNKVAAPITREDVTELIAMAEGENDGADWVIVGKVQDGRFFFLRAGCDYTGWD